MNLSVLAPLRPPAPPAGTPVPWAAVDRLPPSAWAAVQALRDSAHTRLAALALPTLRDEAWRFTDLAPLKRLSLQPAPPTAPLQAADIAPFLLAEATTRLVFVDGVHAPQLSSQAEGSEGAVVANLPQARAAQGALIQAHLGHHQVLAGNWFATLNTAFLGDAAVIVVPRQMALAAPVHLLFVTTGATTLSHPRCLLVAEAGSSLTLVEDHVALQPATSLSNPVAEIVLADGAHVQHLRVQRDSLQAFHIANATVSLGRGSQYRTVSVAMGAQLSRYQVEVTLGEGAECTLDGLALVAGTQLADTHSRITHARPQARSRQLHKCIADGSARAVFNGQVRVDAGAQHTDAVQMSRNLLLSARARIDTQPQLEILADDVKCAHGATVAPLDEEEVFYLKSRGLADAAARELLTYAFGAELIERIAVPSLRRQLQQRMGDQARGRA